MSLLDGLQGAPWGPQHGGPRRGRPKKTLAPSPVAVGQGEASRAVAQSIRSIMVGKCILRSDSESNILAIAGLAKKGLPGQVRLDQTPSRSSQGNGSAERAARAACEQIRVFRHAVQGIYGNRSRRHITSGHGWHGMLDLS